MPFIDYTDHGDGSFSFHDDMGTITPPMAGPAALQQKNKIDANVKPMDPIPTSPRIRGERAELSPEMLEAGGMGEDLRTASLTDDAISGMIKAPNGSIMDAGGAPRGLPPSASDAPLSVPGFENLIADEKTGTLYRRPPTAPKSAPPPADPQTQKIIEDLDAKAGIPKTQPGPRYGTKEQALTDEAIVPEKDRIQLKMPGQEGLQFAPAPGGGGGSAPQLKEMKVGEGLGFTTYDPETQANLKRAYQNQYEAVGQLGDAQQKAGANMTGQLAEIPVGLTALEQERQQKEEHIAQRVQEDHEHLDQLRQETRKDIDPNAFWKNKSAAERFMGALAMGVGAYVQTMAGGQNNAMNIINGAIQTEIDAQKANKSAAHERFKDMRGQMSERRQLFADERQNFLAKKSAYLEQADRKLGTYMSEAKTDEQKAQIADMQALVQQAAEKINLEFGKVSHQVQTKVVQVGGAKPAGAGISELDHEKYVPQFGGLAPTAAEATLARQKGAGLDTMRRLVAENVRLREHPEAFVKGSDKYAELKSNQAKMILTLKRKENEDLGVIAGPDMDLMLGAIGDGQSIVPGQTAAMKNFMANENRVNENVRRNIGLIPVETAPIRDEKTGEVKIGQMVTGNIVTPNNVSGRYNKPVQTVHIAKTSRQEKK
jgi:hypothetical protein